jgi:flagellar protein FlaI
MAFYDREHTAKEKPAAKPVATPISKPTSAPITNPAPISKAPASKDLASLPEKSELDLADVKAKAQVTELEAGATENLLQDLVEGESIQTVLDKITDIIKKQGGKAKFTDLVEQSGLSKKEVTYFIRILNKGDLVSVYYPTNPFSPPVVSMTEKTGFKDLVDEEIKGDKKLLENYTVISDYVVADVNIWSVPFENTPIYQVVPHKLSPGTHALVLELVDEMARIIPVKLDDITDPRKLLELKQKFYDKAKEVLKTAIPTITEETLKVLAGTLLHYSYGLGDMEIIMADNWLEEVAINGAKQPITVYHRRYGWLKTNKKFESEHEIYNFASQIGRKAGKQISSLDPIMDAHMLTGDRVAATLFPISTEGDTITIRRFARNPWTIAHMVDTKNHTMSMEMMAFLWMCIQYELNVMVVGGTASGKTSVLNTLCSLIPPTNRIITIEDTREISLPEALHWNWVPLSSRSKNAEGAGEVTMLDLMVASLRMRPDRIIVGEIRRKQQAEALFEAMHTGHSVCATMHADTSEQVKRRLTQPPIEIPETELQALQLVLVQYRDRRQGVRRSLEIAELLPGGSDEKINLNYLYRWRPRKDTFEKDSTSIRIFEDLNLHTGMTITDIEEDLTEKVRILKWLLENNIKDINKVGQIMRIYYKYPKLLMDTIIDGGKPAV